MKSLILLALLVSLAPAQNPIWQPVPLVTQAQLASGYRGGEGGQWPRSLAFGPDGQFALLGIDVGGIFRSFDGGRTWSPANVGYVPRGAAAFAIDPGNPRRVLAVGVNSATAKHHGIYLSEDQAASWRPVLTQDMSGIDEQRDQLVFDPTTYDASAGLTRVAYWSKVRKDKPIFGSSNDDPALFKSTDGGRTWSRVPGGELVAGANLRHHPTAPNLVYAGNELGLFRSTDGAATWRKVLDGPILGCDVTPARPDRLVASRADGVWRSDDRGTSWRNLGGPTLPNHFLNNVKISPANANFMVLWRNQEPNTWNWARFRTLDGGVTWEQASLDFTNAFLPQNSRQGLFAWSPKNQNILLSLGGDSVTRSTDSGKTYRISNTGNNGVLVGGRWAFSLNSPNTLFFGSQDYNGAVTQNAGRTWTYTPISDWGWGGFCYGGYAVTANFLVVGNADGWGGKRILRVSQDGGATWRDTKIQLSGPDVSYGVPGKPNIAFAFDHRTEDGGTTWTKMTGCVGVFAHGPGVLFGAGPSGVVRSVDQGRTWTSFAPTTQEIKDLAYDPVRRRLYAVLGDAAFVWQNRTWVKLNIPPNSMNFECAKTVAVDPVDPSVVYVGSAGNVLAASNAVVRSTNAGESWTVLTVNQPLTAGVVDGGREAICIRVHSRTREAFVATSCYGIWKIGPPVAAPSAKSSNNTHGIQKRENAWQSK